VLHLEVVDRRRTTNRPTVYFLATFSCKTCRWTASQLSIMIVHNLACRYTEATKDACEIQYDAMAYEFNMDWKDECRCQLYLVHMTKN